MFFIGNAFADGAAAAQSSNWMSFLPMLAFVAILYFLLIRPQQKRAKQHQALVAAVKKGDKVVTNSGIIGTVSKVLNEQEIMLEIADGVNCKFVKSAITSVLNENGEKVADSSASCGCPAQLKKPVQQKKPATKTTKSETKKTTES